MAPTRRTPTTGVTEARADPATRIGVIGLGGMGLRHCRAAEKIPKAKLAAVCDIAQAALDNAIAHHTDSRGYTSWQDLLQQEALNLLVIATNGPSHAEIALAAAEAGVPRLLVEKPMATSLSDANKMIGLCRAKGVRLGVNHSRRWAPAYVRLADLLASGLIGNLRHFAFSIGGGRLCCLGSHCFDLVRFLTKAEPVRVVGYLDQTGTPNPRGPQFYDPGGYGMAWFDNGTRVFFDESEDFGTPLRFQVIGSHGSISVDEGSGDWQVWVRPEQYRHLPISYQSPLERHEFHGEPVDIVDCARQAMIELLDIAPIRCDGEDGLASLQLVIAVHASHEQHNRPVELPLSAQYHSKQFTFT